MIIYAKTGVKAKKVAARIYIREEGIVLRLFFCKIGDHRAYIEAAPDHIRDVFSGSHGDCHRCPTKPGGVCAFRKTYTIDGRLMVKCSGTVFELHNSTLEKLPDYVDLLHEFYAVKRRSR